MKIANIMKFKSKVNYKNFTMDTKYSKSNFFRLFRKIFQTSKFGAGLKNNENHKGVLLPGGQKRLLAASPDKSVSGRKRLLTEAR